MSNPIAWMVYTQDGQSAYVTDNPRDIKSGQKALPLYTAPPALQPLTDAQINARIAASEVYEYHPGAIVELVREVERLHGIGAPA